jgi:hypothetical protein
MKHSTPTVRKVIFGFTDDVSENVINIGKVAIAANASPRPTGLVSPSSCAARLNPRRCMTATASKHVATSNVLRMLRTMSHSLEAGLASRWDVPLRSKVARVTRSDGSCAS